MINMMVVTIGGLIAFSVVLLLQVKTFAEIKERMKGIDFKPNFEGIKLPKVEKMPKKEKKLVFNKYLSDIYFDQIMKNDKNLNSLYRTYYLSQLGLFTFGAILLLLAGLFITEHSFAIAVLIVLYLAMSLMYIIPMQKEDQELFKVEVF